MPRRVSNRIGVDRSIAVAIMSPSRHVSNGSFFQVHVRNDLLPYDNAVRSDG